MKPDDNHGNTKCACPKCTIMVNKGEYTYPYCVQCYANPEQCKK